jgi:pSer/pThr/pTyr-binding forkhead associated (FHA) protein
VTCYLEVWRPGGPQLIPLVAEQVTIGRHPGCDLVIEHDGSVSRHHARLEAVAGAWCVQDVGSKAGTFVAGQQIIGVRALHDGDELRLGRTRLVFRSTEPPVVDATLTDDERLPRLTDRERDVLIALCRPLLVAAGRFSEPASTRRIGEELFIGETAVKGHLQRLYDKFGLPPGEGRRRVELANAAVTRGAVTLADLVRSSEQPPP